MRTARLGAPTEPPRVAFAVGRSVGNAVRRNRVRRRVAAAVREHRALLAPGCGYLFRPLPSAGEATFRDLSESVRTLLSRQVAG